jgi:RNA polymerase sigma factor (TIGR02999 family)
MLSAMSDAKQLLEAAERGDAVAASELLPLVYGELRRLAAVRLLEWQSEHTLNATALAHEAYVRLAGGERKAGWEGSRHFLGAAAEAMRRILVERARAKKRQKRGGGMRRADVDPDQLVGEQTDESDQLLAIHSALDRFAEVDPSKAELVKLRYFGGCTLEEAAALLGVSAPTADRHWAYAKAWLRSEILRAEQGTARD